MTRLLGLIALLGAAPLCFAAPPSANAKVSKKGGPSIAPAAAPVALSPVGTARKLFDERGTADGMSKIDQAIAILEALPTDFDARILAAHAYYWRGMHLPEKAERMAAFDKGLRHALAAKEMKPELADPYYYAGINLARWAETKGIFESLGRREELMGYMSAAIERPTQAGGKGGELDGFGPHRLLGRVYFKLPGLFGGSRKKSLEHLRIAQAGAPFYPNNVNFLAETLKGGSDLEEAEARKLLDDLLAKDASSLTPGRQPETLEELADSRALRQKL